MQLRFDRGSGSAHPPPPPPSPPPPPLPPSPAAGVDPGVDGAERCVEALETAEVQRERAEIEPAEVAPGRADVEATEVPLRGVGGGGLADRVPVFEGALAAGPSLAADATGATPLSQLLAEQRELGIEVVHQQNRGAGARGVGERLPRIL